MVDFSRSAASFSSLGSVFRKPHKDDSAHDLHLRTVSHVYTSRCVVRKSNLLRQVFEAIVAIALLYVGTIFPFRLCFIEFRILDPEHDKGWLQGVEEVIDIVFWIDLVANFFFSFTDRYGKEVTNLRSICINYLQGFFFFNLLACFPPQLITLTMDTATGFNKGLRLGRVQQISRLTRLTRMARLIRLAAFVSKYFVSQKLQQTRAVLFANFVCGLFWVVHLLACGWYLCAALHSDPTHTWVGRRNVLNDDDATLLNASPAEQWIHAMYFVLTVFTTVGFGDIHAVTTGEIVYAGVTMMVGAVVHSIAVSGMINLVMKVDNETIERNRQVELIDGFARQTELDSSTASEFRRWAGTSVAARGAYDREQMCNLLTSSLIPREIIVQLPEAMFGGELKRNRFILDCFQGVSVLPPRFPALVALMLSHRRYMSGEHVYHSYEQSWNLFLVSKGTFANIGRPGPTGGTCPAVCAGDEYDAVLQHETSMRESEPDTSENPTLLTRLRSRYINFEKGKGKPNICNGGFYPYQLFGPGTYFGDSELFENVERRSHVRCESSSGSLLVLHKKDCQRLMEDFPSFRRVWLVSAKHRELRRKALLSRLVVGHTCKNMAALTIQHYFRSRRAVTRSIPSAQNTPTRCDSNSVGSDSGVRLPRSLRADGPCLRARQRSYCTSPRDTVPALKADVDVVKMPNPEGAVAALQADVCALRAEMRAGFQQLQMCWQDVGAMCRAQAQGQHLGHLPP
jgi:CRP-like cAMP-binding protein